MKAAEEAAEEAAVEASEEAAEEAAVKAAEEAAEEVAIATVLIVSTGRQKGMAGYARECKAMAGHGSPWKAMEAHGKPWKQRTPHCIEHVIQLLQLAVLIRKRLRAHRGVIAVACRAVGVGVVAGVRAVLVRRGRCRRRRFRRLGLV